jgi:putative transcriptional regulator
MIKYHPDHNILAEYSAGSLDWALSLGVAAHLHFCRECRKTLAEFNQVGAAVLDQCPEVPVKEAVLSSLMTRIQTQSTHPVAPESRPENLHPSVERDTMLANLPKVVHKLMPRDKPLRWQKVAPSLKMARLTAGQDKYEVAFHRICSGGTVAHHDHRGLEVTLVLKGSFSDGDGIYGPGDFLVRQPGEAHKPTAAQNEDCLCFSICAAPVRLTGLLGRFINPFLSIRPA